jgi:hypothetical protein
MTYQGIKRLIGVVGVEAATDIARDFVAAQRERWAARDRDLLDDADDTDEQHRLAQLGYWD